MSFRNDATLCGVRPKRGLWIVHQERQRTYGRVVRALDDGTVIWLGSFGQRVPTQAQSLIDGGYSYSSQPLVVHP